MGTDTLTVVPGKAQGVDGACTDPNSCRHFTKLSGQEDSSPQRAKLASWPPPVMAWSPIQVKVAKVAKVTKTLGTGPGPEQIRSKL